MASPGFLIVDFNSGWATSYDGVSWVTGSMPIYGWGCVGYNGFYFVASGWQSATSVDGTSWTLGGMSPNAPNFYPNSICFDGSMWVAEDPATGNLDQTFDGQNWVHLGGAMSGPGPWNMIASDKAGTILNCNQDKTCAAWNGTLFLEIAGPHSYTLTPPSTWAYHFNVLPNKFWASVAYGPVTIAGEGGPVTDNYWLTVEPDTGMCAASANNGSSWFTNSMPDTNGWHSVAYANGAFVAVGTANIAVTLDAGATWTLHPLPTGADGNIISGNVLASAPPAPPFWTNKVGATEYDT